MKKIQKKNLVGGLDVSKNRVGVVVLNPKNGKIIYHNTFFRKLGVDSEEAFASMVGEALRLLAKDIGVWVVENNRFPKGLVWGGFIMALNDCSEMRGRILQELKGEKIVFIQPDSRTKEVRASRMKLLYGKKNDMKLFSQDEIDALAVVDKYLQEKRSAEKLCVALS